jgi:hypothetical protein
VTVTTTPSTLQPFVEKIAHAVVNVVPQLADAVQRELQPTTIDQRGLQPVAADHSTTTVLSTTPAVPTPPCGPDLVQVSSGSYITNYGYKFLVFRVCMVNC